MQIPRVNSHSLMSWVVSSGLWVFMNNKKAQLSLHIEGIGMCTGRVCVNDSLVVSVPDWMEVRVSCPLIGQYSGILRIILSILNLRTSVSLPARDIIRFKWFQLLKRDYQKLNDKAEPLDVQDTYLGEIHHSQINKPLQGMAPTECPLSACLLSCLLACLLTCLLACLLALLSFCLP